MITWCTCIVPIALLTLARLTDPAGVQISAEVAVAIENGPVVVRLRLTNTGTMPRCLLINEASGSARVSYEFKGASLPKQRQMPLSARSFKNQGDTFSAPIKLEPGCSTHEYRVYLDHGSIFEGGAKYDLRLRLAYRVVQDDGQLKAKISGTRIGFRVRPDSPASRQEVLSHLLTLISAPTLDLNDYEYCSRVLASCQHKMYLSAIERLLLRQPNTARGLPCPLNTGDYRDEAVSELLVTALYNCSETLRDAFKTIRSILSKSPTTTISPFWSFWSRQERVRLDHILICLEVLGLRESPAIGLVTIPRPQSRIFANIRHSNMCLEAGERKAIFDCSNPWIQAFLVLAEPEAFDESASLRVQRKLESLIGMIDAKQYASVILDLKSSAFRTRERAERELTTFGYRVQNQLSTSIRSEVDAEARAREERILSAIESAQVPPIVFEVLAAATLCDKRVSKPILASIYESQLPATIRERARLALITIDRHE